MLLLNYLFSPVLIGKYIFKEIARCKSYFLALQNDMFKLLGIKLATLIPFTNPLYNLNQSCSK